MTPETIKAVAMEALSQWEVVARALDSAYKVEGDSVWLLNPHRDDHSRGSYGFNWRTGASCDFATGGKGDADLVGFWASHKGISQGQAAQEIADLLSLNLPLLEAHPQPGASRSAALCPVPQEAIAALHAFKSWAIQNRHAKAFWGVRDTEGALLLLRVRVEPPGEGKRVLPFSWDCEKQKWVQGGSFSSVFYGLEGLLKRPTAPVLLVEGEKTADAAATVFLEYVVLGFMGAGSVRKVDLGPLQGRSVCIWPDADQEGIEAARSLAARCREAGIPARVVVPGEALSSWIKPGKSEPGGWDLADPVPDGVDLQALMADAAEWVHPTLALVKEPASQPWIIGDIGKMLSEQPPEVAWLVEGLIPAGLPGIFASEGGIGKSSMALLISLGLASRKGVLGRAVSPEAACGVVFVSMEDEKDEWHRRLHRAMELMREDPTWGIQDEAGICERLRPLFPNRGGGADFRLESAWKNIAEVANSIPGGCGLIFLDTFSRLSGGDENSVKETRPFLEAQSALAQCTGASVIAIHHVAKGNSTTSEKNLQGRLHVDAIRGSSAIVNNVRFALMLATLSQAEAASASLDPDQALRGAYVAFRLAKMSCGPQQPTLLLERRESGMPGSGFLCPHPDSDRVLAILQGATAILKLNKRDEVLCAIAEAGDLKDLDQKRAAELIWPDAANPKGQWDKQLTALRRANPPLLSDPYLTEAGWAKAETMGVSSARKRGITQHPSQSQQPCPFPLLPGETEEMEEKTSFHSVSLGGRNGRKDELDVSGADWGTV